MRSLSAFLTGLVMIALLSADGTALASTYQAMKKGAESYRQGKYDESASLFQQAQVESPDDPRIRFNLASARYQAGKFDEAATGFESVAAESKDPKLKQKAFYNLGNAAFRQGNLQAAADNYRKALDLDPSDLDAKQNLEFVLKEQEKPEQKKNDQDQKGKDKNKEQQSSKPQQGQDQKKQNASSQKQEKNKDQQGTPPQSPQDQGQKHEQGEIKEAEGERKQGDKQKGAQSGKPLEPGAIAPEEAERLLNSLSDDQHAFLKEQAKRLAPGRSGTEKDW